MRNKTPFLYFFDTCFEIYTPKYVKIIFLMLTESIMTNAKQIRFKMKDLRVQKCRKYINDIIESIWNSEIVYFHHI